MTEQLNVSRDAGTVPLGPYTTSYKRDYPQKPALAAEAERPGTAQAFQASYDLDGPIGVTSYQNEYYNKGQKNSPPIRTGSASGNRRNNPHPLETFMIWKLPQIPAREGSQEMTQEMMDKISRGKLMSTYQQDYLGIPQDALQSFGVDVNLCNIMKAYERALQSCRVQVSSDYDGIEDWKSKVPYTLDSSSRHTYQKPELNRDLKGNSTRYGCNKTKQIPAHGVVPTVSKRQIGVKNQTTYERDFTESSKNKQEADLCMQCQTKCQ